MKIVGALLAIELSCSTGIMAAEVKFQDKNVFSDYKKITEIAGLQCNGMAKQERLHTKVGTIEKSYDVLSLKGKGSSVSMSLSTDSPDKLTVVEIQEIHQRRKENFGYTVKVNGEDVYFRNYRELAEGPNHYFIAIPPKFFNGKKDFELCFESESGAEFSLAKLWVYPDFFATTARDENVFRKMGILVPLKQQQIAPSLSEAEQIEKVKELYSGYKDYEFYGFYYHSLLYAAQPLGQNKRRFKEILNLSAKTDTIAQISMNATGWGGAPQGPDGMGGYFSDLSYSQVALNPVTKRYSASWPNLWNNTMSPTFSSPVMQKVMRSKYNNLLSAGIDARDFLVAQGNPAPSPLIVREHGLDNIAFGDLSHYNQLAAKRDGIDLSKQDMKAKMWLFDNLSNIFKWMAEDMSKGVGRNPVFIDNGKVALPEEQFFESLYGHIFAGKVKPLNDYAYMGWQNGVQKDMWTCGEFAGYKMKYPMAIMYDYIRAQGRLVCANQERPVLKDESFIVFKNHYEAGFLFETLYSGGKGDEKLIRRFDNIANNSLMEHRTYEPVCLDLDFTKDHTLGNKNTIAEIENMQLRISPSYHNIPKLVVKDPSKPGHITYRLTNLGEKFESDLVMEMNGRISKGATITLYAGVDINQLKKIAVLTEKNLPAPPYWTFVQSSEYKLHLGPGAIGQKEYYLKMTFDSPSMFDRAFLIKYSIGMSWGRPVGQLTDFQFNAKQMRTLNLWMQDRFMAKNMLLKYSEVAGKDADYQHALALFNAGLYNSAHKYLVGRISLALPAKFSLKGHGQLGEYPVKITLKDKDAALVAELVEINKKGAKIQLKTLKAQNCQLEFSGLENEKYSLKKVGRWSYQLALDTEGKKAIDGNLQFNVHLEPDGVVQKTLPQQMQASLLHAAKNEWQVQTQDVAYTDYAMSIDIPVAPNAQIVRTAAVLRDAREEKKAPQKFDSLALTIKEGKVIKAVCKYGYDKGKIKRFTPPSLAKGPAVNGVVELENGNSYELGHNYTKADTAFLKESLSFYEVSKIAQAFYPGQEVEIHFNPYTFKGSLPRITKISSPYHVLFEADYLKNEGDDWKKHCVDTKGVEVLNYQPEPNYLQHRWQVNVMRQKEDFVPGYVTYKIQSDKALRECAIEFMARAFDDGSRTEFFFSTNNKSWQKITQFDNSWKSFIPLTFEKGWQYINITKFAKGLKSFYIKIVINNNGDDGRACLAKFRVVAQGAPYETKRQ